MVSRLQLLKRETQSSFFQCGRPSAWRKSDASVSARRPQRRQACVGPQPEDVSHGVPIFTFHFSLFAIRRPRRRAFTLVECLIAGTVLAIFGASIAIAAAQSTAATRRGGDRRAAAQRLDAVLTKIDVLGPARLATEGPFGGELDDGPGGRGWSWSTTIAEEGTWPDLYLVGVTITWTDSTGQPRSVTTRTRLFDPVGSRTVRVGWDELE